jgi:hypothetical protein
MSLLTIFVLLVCAHALCDYPLQGDFLSKAKNRFSPLPEIPWHIALGSHAAIHAGGVLLITGRLELAFAEFVLHCVIDDLKCGRRISFAMDQALHVGCKGAYVVAIHVI